MSTTTTTTTQLPPLETKQKKHKEWLKKYNFMYSPVDSEEILDAILLLLYNENGENEKNIQQSLCETNSDYIRHVGLYYLEKKQYDKMSEYYQKGVTLFQNPYCMYGLGYYYHHHITPSEPFKMIEYMSQADALYLSEATFYLGHYYINEKEDAILGFQYLEKAMKMKNKHSYTTAIRFFAKDSTQFSKIPSCFEELLQLFDEKIQEEKNEKGDLLLWIGCLFLKQTDEKYKTQGMNYLRQGVTLNNTNCMIVLAQENKTMNKINLMLYFLELAAQQNDSEAMFQLATYYDEINDKEQALKWYFMAAQNNYRPALTNLGAYYQAKNDETNMLLYYKRAIEQQEYCAMINLANYYRSKNNIKEMIYYFQLVINLKNKGILQELLESVTDEKNLSIRMELSKLFTNLDLTTFSDETDSQHTTFFEVV